MEAERPQRDVVVKKHIAAAIALLILVMGLGISGVLLFAKAEKQRDLQILQSQMNLVVDSRVEAVSGWLSRQYGILTGLAQNESLQLYTKLIEMSGADQPFEEDPAQRTYLRTLLSATAERAGFLSRRLGRPLPANVKPIGTAGLALVDPEGAIIVATHGMPPLQGHLEQFLRQVPLTERRLLDLHLAPTGDPTLGFLVPVFAQQEDEAAAGVIARILGLRPAERSFFATLEQPGITAKTAESYLIRRNGNMTEYLSPLLDGSAPLAKRLAVNSEGLLDIAALDAPGRFHMGMDYAGQASFAVSRPVAGTEWILVHKLEAAEAMAASNARRLALASGLLAAVILIGATLIVVWRYATSLRAEEAARRFRLSSERFENLSGFLDIVSDSQPHPIFVTDASHSLTFANRRMAEVTGVPKQELPGRSLIGMLGHDKGTYFNKINQGVLASGQSSTETSVFLDEQGQEQVWRSCHTPLDPTQDRPAAVLSTIQDLTDLVSERKRREQNTRQLIATLVGLVDERDPDSAHQSRDVVRVARQIGEDMGLDADMVETTVQAAQLVNIGKIRVPRSLLTKEGSLTEEEMRLVRAAMDEGPGLLEGIQFDGPVIETLRQINEWIDGSGRPRGLSGEDILLSAQAVALANSFVALISPRAFRDGKTLEEAESILMQEIGRRFDRRPVLSLLNYLNNKGGRETWAARTRS